MFCYDPERPVADVETIYKFSSLVKKSRLHGHIQNPVKHL